MDRSRDILSEAFVFEVSKSDDIDKYVIPEGLSDYERIAFLLNNGTSVQKMSALEMLPRAANDRGSSGSDKILQEMAENMWKQDTEIQLACAPAVQSLLPNLSHPQLRVALPLIRTMIAIRNEDVSQQWIEVLIDCISHLPQQVLEGEILDMATQKGGLSEPVNSRVLCCRMLGALARRLGGDTVERSFFIKAMSMCQDTDYEVRIAMCKQLNWIARCVGLDPSKRVLSQELFELLKDEERDVKCAALDALIDVMDFFDVSFRKQSILPICKRLISNVSDDIFRQLVTRYGELIWKLSGDLDDEEDIILFCAFFRESAQKTDPECKRLCAFNFPAVLKSIGARRFALHLHSTFCVLAEDQSSAVRKCIASGFHEVATILGKERSVQYLREPFIGLLRDENLDIQDALVDHLDVILSQFAVSNEEQRTSTYATIFSNLLNYEAMVRRTWRRLHALLSRADKFADFFQSDLLYERFIPLLFSYLANSAAPVKALAARLLVLYSRKINSASHRNEIIRKLADEFGRGHSFWHRMNYVEACFHVADRYSRRFFRETVLDCLLDLAKDRVPNVRIKFCSILPLLKRVLRPPSDVATLAKFNESVSLLMLDKDRDVADAARSAQTKMAEIEAEFQRDSKLRLESQDDVLDKKKEEEEKQAAAQEQEAEKSKRRKEIVDRLRTELKRRDDGAPSSGGSAGGSGSNPSSSYGGLSSSYSSSSSSGLSYASSSLGSASSSAARRLSALDKPLPGSSAGSSASKITSGLSSMSLSSLTSVGPSGSSSSRLKPNSLSSAGSSVSLGSPGFGVSPGLSISSSRNKLGDSRIAGSSSSSSSTPTPSLGKSPAPARPSGISSASSSSVSSSSSSSTPVRKSSAGASQPIAVAKGSTFRSRSVT